MGKIVLLSLTDKWLLLLLSTLFMLLLIGYFLIDKFTRFFYRHDIIQLIYVVLLILFAIILIICLITWSYYWLYSPQREPLYYFEMLTEYRSLEDALHTTKDLVNTDLYLRAIDFNTRLELYQNISTNSMYAPMRWSMDWTAIPKIMFD